MFQKILNSTGFYCALSVIPVEEGNFINSGVSHDMVHSGTQLLSGIKALYCHLNIYMLISSQNSFPTLFIYAPSGGMITSAQQITVNVFNFPKHKKYFKLIYIYFK